MSWVGILGGRTLLGLVKPVVRTRGQNGIWEAMGEFQLGRKVGSVRLMLWGRLGRRSPLDHHIRWLLVEGELGLDLGLAFPCSGRLSGVRPGAEAGAGIQLLWAGR